MWESKLLVDQLSPETCGEMSMGTSQCVGEGRGVGGWA